MRKKTEDKSNLENPLFSISCLTLFVCMYVYIFLSEQRANSTNIIRLENPNICPTYSKAW